MYTNEVKITLAPIKKHILLFLLIILSLWAIHANIIDIISYLIDTKVHPVSNVMQILFALFFLVTLIFSGREVHFWFRFKSPHSFNFSEPLVIELSPRGAISFLVLLAKIFVFSLTLYIIIWCIMTSNIPELNMKAKYSH